MSADLEHLVIEITNDSNDMLMQKPLHDKHGFLEGEQNKRDRYDGLKRKLDSYEINKVNIHMTQHKAVPRGITREATMYSISTALHSYAHQHT